MNPSYNEREVLALLHFRQNASLFHLLLEAAQRDIEVVIVFVQKHSGHEYHPLLRELRPGRAMTRASFDLVCKVKDSLVVLMPKKGKHFFTGHIKERAAGAGPCRKVPKGRKGYSASESSSSQASKTLSCMSSSSST